MPSLKRVLFLLITLSLIFSPTLQASEELVWPTGEESRLALIAKEVFTYFGLKKEPGKLVKYKTEKRPEEVLRTVANLIMGNLSMKDGETQVRNRLDILRATVNEVEASQLLSEQEIEFKMNNLENLFEIRKAVYEEVSQGNMTTRTVAIGLAITLVAAAIFLHIKVKRNYELTKQFDIFFVWLVLGGGALASVFYGELINYVRNIGYSLEAIDLIQEELFSISQTD